MKIGRRIPIVRLLTYARIEAGLTQEALARILGVSTRTVLRWERGEVSPSALALSKIRAFLK